MRVLLSTWHNVLDPTNGAASSARDLVQLLAAAGCPCRVLCGPRLDNPGGIAGVLAVMAASGSGVRDRLWPLRPPARVIEAEDGPVTTTVWVPPSDTRPAPCDAETRPFLATHEWLLDRFAPDVVLTYGGHQVGRALIAACRQREIPVLFMLHNRGYQRSGLLAGLTPWVPSEWMALHYKERLELDCAVLPPVIRPERVVAPDPDQAFLTFVGPLPAKGLGLVARLFRELAVRRPDVPLLVVEGRGSLAALARAARQLGGIPNLQVIDEAVEARRIFARTRVLLAPSVAEPFGMVAVEAMMNGIPVVGANRAGLLEAMAGGGIPLPLPERLVEQPDAVATVQEVLSWLRVVLELWDYPDRYREASERARAAARAFEPEALLPRYLALLGELAERRPRRTDPHPEGHLVLPPDKFPARVLPRPPDAPLRLQPLPTLP